ncbi:MAG: hypothetical protein ACXVEE_19720 [Polyangiales bacterium]
MEFLIVAAIFGALVALVRMNFDETRAGKLLPFFAGGFLLRLVVHVMMRQGVFEYGGDNRSYETFAEVVSAMWRSDGISFVTASDYPAMQSVAVPVNCFAMFMYICGGPAPVACTAFVALIASGLAIVIYHFAKLIGADDDAATKLMLVNFFGPSFVIHTADMYKDGINAFLVVTSLYLAIHISKKLSLVRLVAIVPLLWCLWYVRPYMVFMCALPLALAVIGMKRALSVWGVTVVLLAMVDALVTVGGEEGKTPEALMIAEEQFNKGSSDTARAFNAEGGSGVMFDDGGQAWGALGPKLVYTLFAPFPWASGSVAFQLGKIETMLWYYLLYCAIRGLPWFWRNDRETLLLIALFVVPATLAYATSMANIGLMFRQRMPITICVSMLSALVWTRTARARRAEEAARLAHAGAL